MVFAVSELKSAQKLWFSPKTVVFRPKSAVSIKIHSFHKKPQIFIKIRSFYQNLWFSSKSAVFIKNRSFRPKLLIFVKIRDFLENPRFLAFLSELSRGQYQIGILCETKDHLPRKLTPFYCFVYLTTILLATLTLRLVLAMHQTKYLESKFGSSSAKFNCINGNMILWIKKLLLNFFYFWCVFTYTELVLCSTILNQTFPYCVLSKDA